MPHSNVYGSVTSDRRAVTHSTRRLNYCAVYNAVAFVISRKTSLLAAALAAAILATSASAFAAPPIIQIPHIETAPTLADFEGMHPGAAVAEHMLKVTGFIAREPADGAQPTQDTDVYLAYDDHNLYAVFICWDKEPDKIRARMTRREDIFSDDSAEIMIDTFNDARRGYAFAANPLGIQWDALWTEGSIGKGLPLDYSGFDQSFDTVWNSEGRLTGQGYMLLITIPFKSLRFPNTDPQQWRIILNRGIPRTNENLFWPRITNRIQGRFNQAAVATGLEMSRVRNIQVIPYGLLRGFRDIDQRDPANPFFESRTLQPEIGLDAKFILHDSFVLDATVNPDFSQVNPISRRSPSTSALRFSFLRKGLSFWRTATTSILPSTLCLRAASLTRSSGCV